jgi:hypothetical protein
MFHDLVTVGFSTIIVWFVRVRERRRPGFYSVKRRSVTLIRPESELVFSMYSHVTKKVLLKMQGTVF